MAHWGKASISTKAVMLREDAKLLEAMALEERWDCCEEVARRMRDLAQETLHACERTREQHAGAH